MSTTETSPVAPEVRLFLARVRHQLADLDPDEVDEMTDGLEADLTELVADRGATALGSPVEYADELRAAAGLDVRSPGRSGRRPIGEAVNGLLDAVRRQTDHLLGRLPRDARPLLEWARPLWWVARAWAALQLGAAAFSGVTGIGYYFFEGGQIEPMPSTELWAWLLLAVAVVISVQVGRGRFWPGGRRGTAARVVQLALNCAAVVAVPYLAVLVGSADSDHSEAYSAGYHSGFSDGFREGGASDDGSFGIDEQLGVYSSGRWVTNIYPYDASGKPLVGVQLFDQLGKPIDVVPAPECPDGSNGWTVTDQGASCADVSGTGDVVAGRVPYPWTNGATQLENVFPLPLRSQLELRPSATAFSQPDPPTIGQLPLASVPPVSLPGVVPSVQAGADR